MERKAIFQAKKYLNEIGPIFLSKNSNPNCRASYDGRIIRKLSKYRKCEKLIVKYNMLQAATKNRVNFTNFKCEKFIKQMAMNQIGTSILG